MSVANHVVCCTFLTAVQAAPSAKGNQMFDQEIVAKMLAQTAPFEKFSHSELKTVSKQMEYRQIKEGEMITRQGQFGDELLVVLSGSATVDVSGTTVSTITEGQVIGEISFLDHGPRSATITATSAMAVGVLTLSAFEKVASQSPAFWRIIAAGLARRLREADRKYHH
jgi:CRP/FNR family transcriptional regulator, cyclic AMP receptor protein